MMNILEGDDEEFFMKISIFRRPQSEKRCFSVCTGFLKFVHVLIVLVAVLINNFVILLGLNITERKLTLT
jgi:hypothetical protein